MVSNERLTDSTSPSSILTSECKDRQNLLVSWAPGKKRAAACASVQLPNFPRGTRASRVHQRASCVGVRTSKVKCPRKLLTLASDIVSVIAVQ